MSWAGTVWRLVGGSGAVYVKRAANLEAERVRTVWLAGRWPVPEVIGFFKAFGDEWLTAARTPVLVVPSAIVPEETNVLVNPAHPATHGVVVVARRRFVYDPRLL